MVFPPEGPDFAVAGGEGLTLHHSSGEMQSIIGPAGYWAYSPRFSQDDDHLIAFVETGPDSGEVAVPSAGGEVEVLAETNVFSSRPTICEDHMVFVEESGNRFSAGLVQFGDSGPTVQRDVSQQWITSPYGRCNEHYEHAVLFSDERLEVYVVLDGEPGRWVVEDLVPVGYPVLTPDGVVYLRGDPVLDESTTAMRWQLDGAVRTTLQEGPIFRIDDLGFLEAEN